MQEQESVPEETSEVAGDVGEPGQSEAGSEAGSEAEPVATKKSKKSKSEFDPNKPHGVVVGDSVAKYFQDGKYYGAKGQEVEI